jgi:hypothetical protein
MNKYENNIKLQIQVLNTDTDRKFFLAFALIVEISLNRCHL